MFTIPLNTATMITSVITSHLNPKQKKDLAPKSQGKKKSLQMIIHMNISVEEVERNEEHLNAWRWLTQREAIGKQGPANCRHGGGG